MALLLASCAHERPAEAPRPAASAPSAPAVLLGQAPERDSVVVVDGRPTKLSLYLPPRGERLPGVVLLPGGNGARGAGQAYPHYHRYAERLAERGIASLVCDYSRPDRGLIDERRVGDIEVAVDALQCNARVDPRRLFVAGFSLGGANALLVAAERHDLAGLITFFAPVDWRATPDGSPPGVVKQPIEYATEVRCPTLVLQGDRDQRTAPEQATLLTRALEAAAVPVQLVLLPGVGHGFTFAGAPAGPCCEFDAEATARSLDLVADFVARTPPARPQRPPSLSGNLPGYPQLRPRLGVRRRRTR